MTLLLISFLAGTLTVLAPCVLPLLPIIIGRSISKENRNTPLIVIASLSLSVLLFTLLLKASTIFISIPQSFWQYLSGGILILFGLFTLFESIWARIVVKLGLREKVNSQFAVGFKKKSIWGDVIMGAALGPVFSTCSPTYFVILATVLPESYAKGIIYILTYILGLSIILFGISILGQKFVFKLEILANPKGWFKRTISIIFIVVGFGIISGFDKKLQVTILDLGFFDVTKVEQMLLKKNEISTEKRLSKNIDSLLYQKPIPAPDISTPDGFINTDGKNINLNRYKGKKIILLDYWTYSCINCQRTIPHLNELYAKYKDAGLEIIGLHTPEFVFERNQKNVAEAVLKFNIKYPVVLDNDYSTWKAYGNQYWPRKYIIDLNGNIVYDHIGEGGYAETEAVIKYLLGISTQNETLPENVDVPTVSRQGSITPEIYFGSNRNSYFGNGPINTDLSQDFTPTKTQKEGFFYLKGNWKVTPEYIELLSENGELAINYTGKTISLVYSVSSPLNITVVNDGKKSNINIAGEQLVKLNEKESLMPGQTKIQFSKDKNKVIRLYTFTFSS